MMHDAALSLACPAGARSDGCTCEFLVAALEECSVPCDSFSQCGCARGTGSGLGRPCLQRITKKNIILADAATLCKCLFVPERVIQEPALTLSLFSPAPATAIPGTAPEVQRCERQPGDSAAPNPHPGIPARLDRSPSYLSL